MNMRTIPYRDHSGFIIEPKSKPIYDESRDKFSGGYSIAVLIFCPNTDGLRHIAKCEKCEFFRGHVKYEGISCASLSQKEPPAYYNRTNPKKDIDL